MRPPDPSSARTSRGRRRRARGGGGAPPARGEIAREPQIHYAQLRPIDGLGQPRKLPLSTDCSGFATLCYAWAGAPDPNGLGHPGGGWTGTLLEHMRAIGADGVQPGDLVVWGPPPGHHVAIVLERGA